MRAVGMKFYHVLYPKEKAALLKECMLTLNLIEMAFDNQTDYICLFCFFLVVGDLWGPLILCTFMATILQGTSDDVNNGGPEFAQVFVIVWIGAMIVTLNSKLLGGNM